MEEAWLLELKRQQELERTRGPKPKWSVHDSDYVMGLGVGQLELEPDPSPPTLQGARPGAIGSSTMAQWQRTCRFHSAHLQLKVCGWKVA